MHTVLKKLVSQAEEEGVPLAQVLVRELSVDEIDRVEEYLKTEMSSNYSAIADFMKDIDIPGSYDFSSMDKGQLDILQEELMHALSDTELRAPSEA